jgi:hypothetical protein
VRIKQEKIYPLVGRWYIEEKDETGRRIFRLNLNIKLDCTESWCHMEMIFKKVWTPEEKS